MIGGLDVPGWLCIVRRVLLFALSRADEDDRHARQKDQKRGPQADLCNATRNLHGIFSRPSSSIPVRLDYIPAFQAGKAILVRPS